MEYVVLPKKEFREKYGSESAGEHYTDEEGKHVVVVPQGASTKSRMHEIAHAELGHEGPAKTYSERAKRELAADSWVYEKLGRTPSMYELLEDFAGDIEELIKEGYSVSGIFNWLKEELENAGYVLEREDRSFLWWAIRNKYDELKGKKK